jgi:hypothetical protein
LIAFLSGDKFKHAKTIRIEWRNRGMPATSKKQQMAAGAALAAKRGERSRSSLKGASRQMARSMSEEQLEDFARTRRKSLPTKKRSRDTNPSSKSARDRKTSSGKSRDR